MKDFSVVIDKLYSIKDKSLLEDFLVGITTPKERDELCRRLAIVEQLILGVPQQTIANNLGVGVATVTRGSKELSLNHFKVLQHSYTQKNLESSQDQEPWQRLQ